MIRKEEILERARSWELRPDVVEKDYVLGWLLAALARNAEVRSNWVFKGGTCLKKCFFETYRFSEDLDFSLRAGAVYTHEGLLDVLKAVAQDAHELSGVDFPLAEIKVVDRHNKQEQATYQGKIPYRGPLGRQQLANILFDLTQHELLAAFESSEWVGSRASTSSSDATTRARPLCSSPLKLWSPRTRRFSSIGPPLSGANHARRTTGGTRPMRSRSTFGAGSTDTGLTRGRLSAFAPPARSHWS